MYLCLPPVWGTAGGDFLNLLYSWYSILIPKKKSSLKDSKRKDSITGRSLYETLQQGAGSSGAPTSGTGTTSEPAVQVSAKGKEGTSLREAFKVKDKVFLVLNSLSSVP
jgi:hypothetical protein